MKTRILLACLGLLAALFSSGCATVVVAQLKGKMPHVEADELAVRLRWAGVQVGVLETSGLHYDANGNLIATSFHEDIGTPTGGIEITGKNVKIPAPSK